MLWISRIFNKKKPSNGFFSILLSTIISCGGIGIAFIPALIQRTYIWSSFSLRMWVGCFLGMIWIALSPFLIDKYINKTNLFFDECEKKCKGKNEIVALKFRFNNGYFTSKRFIIFSLGWITLLIATLLLDCSYLNKYGIRGFSDIYFYIFILSLIYILYLTSIGLYAIISSLYFVIKILRSSGLNIDFYSSDIRGQLHYVVEYVFSALKIISTGMLFIPILLDYIEYTHLNLVKLLLYFAIIFYSFSLFVALYIPLREIVKYFNKLKMKELKKT